MRRTYRERFDLQVAFESAARRHAAKPPAELPAEAVAETAGTPDFLAGFQAPPIAAEGRWRQAGARAKALGRPVARLLFRVVKPLLRPVAYRFRRFLLDGLREREAELHRAMQAIADRLHRIEQLAAANRPGPGEGAVTGCIAPDPVAGVGKSVAVDVRRCRGEAGAREFLVRTAAGYVFCPARDHAAVVALLEGGETKDGVHLLIEHLVGPGSTFVDIGAGLGIHALAAATAMRGRGLAILCEPGAQARKRLARTLAVNGFSSITRIHPAAPDPGTDCWPAADLVRLDATNPEPGALDAAARLLGRNPETGLILLLGAGGPDRRGQMTGEWLENLQVMGLYGTVLDPRTGRWERAMVEGLHAQAPGAVFLARPESAIWLKASSA